MQCDLLELAEELRKDVSDQVHETVCISLAGFDADQVAELVTYALTAVALEFLGHLLGRDAGVARMQTDLHNLHRMHYVP